MRNLIVSPHNDDETLFAGFIGIREQASVVIAIQSRVQVLRGNEECTAAARNLETFNALQCLGLSNPLVLSDVYDDDVNESELAGGLAHLARHHRPPVVWLPAIEAYGHPHHNLVGEVGTRIFSKHVIRYYLTYTRSRGRSTPETWRPAGAMPIDAIAREVRITGREWVGRKLKALACYTTQLENEALGCREHFLNGLREYEVY